MKVIRIENVFSSNPSISWFSVDVELDDGTILRDVDVIDNGTSINVNGADPALREQIIGATFEEAKRRQR
ncbi:MULTISPECIES: hypothetical protein [Rhizobium]|uniref:hypothetical protein n=1 Tax=Rhizobium TaxID=379 RepID=UPI00040492E2|nr:MULTISPECIES: hypothetical protein [Rhizobium]KPN22655.1 hypothetical protein KS05_32370 [Rhizobium brockwellii]QJS27177.1 hypothetical protein RLTA1_07640 [Rhizobium leguminosarum bv. trifolii TA1]QJX04748.1 hypothetical protein RLCC275e_07205 [Rhizobium brockwellii]UFW95917.1 hypothetical protein RlegTA1_07615 [Rhizobium ruizarguesonis]